MEVNGLQWTSRTSPPQILMAFVKKTSCASSLPWVIIGDLNDILYVSDKRGMVDHPNWLFAGFRNAVMDCNLIDLPLHGYQFTWSRCRGTANSIEERLGRAMASSSWIDLFPDACLMNSVAPVSDHSPILLQTISLIHSGYIK